VGLLSWPLAPVTGVIKIAEVLQRQVDNEMHGRSTVRHQLEELEEARASGRISEEQELQGEREILDRTMGRPSGGDAGESVAEEER
jgi:hypothetical protein